MGQMAICACDHVLELRKFEMKRNYILYYFYTLKILMTEEGEES